MPNGKVKWFNNAKGYGFIRPEGGGDDLFAHFSAVRREGYRTLRAGQAVRYTLSQGPKGWLAVDIEPIESDSDEESDCPEGDDRGSPVAAPREHNREHNVAEPAMMASNAQSAMGHGD